MADIKNLCPQCRQPLELTTVGDYDTWQCPASDGRGVVLTEAWGHLQDDELRSIWEAAKKGTPSRLKSPALGHPMVDITVVADSDEIEGNEGVGGSSITLSVAPDEQFLWFSGELLSAMADDIDNPEPSADQLAKESQIIDEFGDNAYEAMKDREAAQMGGLEGIADKFADAVHAHRTARKIVSRISRNS